MPQRGDVCIRSIVDHPPKRVKRFLGIETTRILFRLIRISNKRITFLRLLLIKFSIKKYDLQSEISDKNAKVKIKRKKEV